MLVEAREYSLMDTAEDGMWWYRAAHARLLRALRRRPGVDGPVLDAGCGTGGLLRRLAEALPERPMGLEYDHAAAERASAKAGVPVARGDLNRLPFADHSFGAAVSADVLCHRAVVPGDALAELRRVLRPGATLVLNLPAFEWLRSAHDARVHNARRFTAGGARAMLADAGFDQVEARYWNSLLLPLMALQRRVLSRHEDSASDVAPFPPLLDSALLAVDAAERALSGIGLRFPAGGSVLVVCTRS